MRLRYTNNFAWLSCFWEAFLFLFVMFLACLPFDPKRNAWRQHTNALNDSKRQHSDRHIDELFYFGATMAC